MNVDPHILEACRRSDRKAQSALYKQCFSLLMGVCVRYVKQEDEAVALLNMGFLKILNNLDRYRSEVPFEAWIRRIMINTVIDEYRKNKKHKALIEYTDQEDKAVYTSDSVAYNDAAEQLEAEEIEQMIRALPPVSQQVFNLYAIDGYSHKEIGEMLRISVGTSKWHVSFARQKIREMLVKAFRTIHMLLL